MTQHNRMTKRLISHYDFKCLCGTVGKAHGYYTIRTYPFEEKRIGSGFETPEQQTFFYHMRYVIMCVCVCACVRACVRVCVQIYLYIS